MNVGRITTPRRGGGGRTVAIDSLLNGRRMVVRFTGELDLVAAAELKAAVDDLVDRGKVTHLYVNLERVTFLDSSFLGALLGRYRRLSQVGGQVGLIRPADSVRPTLELSGLFQTMVEYSSEEEALAAG